MQGKNRIHLFYCVYVILMKTVCCFKIWAWYKEKETYDGIRCICGPIAQSVIKV